ncbi:TetR/AcrR family transcriptional regulator [Oceanirhabdus sp. W0125-5]|uniref:TetR/AcrR family transcriptional regulator n=1 Tax=Oceanirhabdus sp. W0125-5 TaxID=2999116 RepID=UPI0022F2C539|nr:TetR/AcrR family transcriptional regulator [Oceanirhabdus sp. W0125-5]WBW96699.1 TetR/AcrR family transcriptional regulator [Oceanirhabdus sp. W0125-5]
MDKKEIQRQRMMKYFIDAAKEIIKEEGVKSLSARKVGERAGYSYATIYNYFDDINTLLTYCVFDFFEDCHKYMVSCQKQGENPKEQVITQGCAYFRYFAENPDMFQLIFLEDLGDAPQKFMQKIKRPSVRNLLRENLIECVKEGYIPEENIELLQDLIPSMLSGKLLFFLKRRNTENLEDMIDLVKKEIEFLLDK